MTGFWRLCRRQRGLIVSVLVMSLASIFASPPSALQNAESLAPQAPQRVRQSYEVNCAMCHGVNGDGKSAKELKDDWGWPILPSNLTWRPLKRGVSLEQIYLTITTGLSGTPMPSFGDALSAKQIWALVYYIESLVPPDQRVPERRRLGEERQGQMMLHMGGMGGRGMMMRGR